MDITPAGIKETRLRAGLTQKAFAEKLGVSHKTVEAWEGGWRKMPVPMQRLLKLVIRPKKV